MTCSSHTHAGQGRCLGLREVDLLSCRGCGGGGGGAGDGDGKLLARIGRCGALQPWGVMGAVRCAVVGMRHVSVRRKGAYCRSGWKAS